ncbi:MULTISPECIES: GGDEF domain-containing protein [unclassified Agarivorans]|uniref:GGDEF domain-containing protein n=1 Tax=unclassified Agarivorans TaxID=2636026 RepID=UPI0026E2BB36|nr:MULTISPECIES: GGDEF domain-containing protein [unclassified Agarivorans]MDO6687354.1 GGDEF domain-containing protein [Agarivorans sp. 3_MG-2023]MDO6717012.1 GGDEF domain-containing protein [Agarivorans sp. 2_MG-2023]MDO6765042.1 GGDEF domain-containing protein [Agarivorans sp. 1_MG-2023]
MSDIITIKKRLALVRNEIDSSNNNPSDQDAKVRMEKKAISQLISRLSKICYGLDEQLDQKLQQLIEDVEQNDDLSAISQYQNELDGLFKQHGETLKTLLAHNQRIIKSSGESLKRINGLPPQLRRKLTDFLEQEPAYSHGDNQQRLEQLLNYYYQALLNKPAFGGAPAGSTDNVASVKPKESVLNSRLHKRICDDLQRLITELDYSGDVGTKLGQVRSDLLVGVEPDELPSMCIKVIQLVIEGSREERKASQEFLYSLNESLGGVHDQFNDSLSQSKSIHKDQKQSDGLLKSRLLELGAEVRSSNDLDALKNSIQSRLIQIADVFKEKEQLEQKTTDLLEQLTDVELKLRLVREETHEYKKRLNAHKHKLFIDSLTQVYNRAALDERLELEYKRWKRYGYNLGMAIIDIDHFKSINDKFGHMAGDKALKVIARALQNNLRDTDFLARFGGEEFVLLMPNISPDAVLVPLDNIREQIKALPFRFKDQQVSITVSIGATLFKESDKPLDAFERADQALYESKSSGRDKVNIIS